MRTMNTCLILVMVFIAIILLVYVVWAVVCKIH